MRQVDYIKCKPNKTQLKRITSAVQLVYEPICKSSTPMATGNNNTATGNSTQLQARVTKQHYRGWPITTIQLI
ncbi:hypothetical protein AWZ03_009521 [Drosophila navojoa]|uniref:Uncharacterized protein n=1 Tax=Drosophila navojoa TaxID=7232 RepID=A0A484B6W1_DRONA|nr:hypothetical protein AWZ03_009521 [Drosophila navojoa]